MVTTILTAKTMTTMMVLEITMIITTARKIEASVIVIVFVFAGFVVVPALSSQCALAKLTVRKLPADVIIRLTQDYHRAMSPLSGRTAWESGRHDPASRHHQTGSAQHPSVSD